MHQMFFNNLENIKFTVNDYTTSAFPGNQKNAFFILVYFADLWYNNKLYCI